MCNEERKVKQKQSKFDVKAIIKSYRNSTSLKKENSNLRITHLIGHYHGAHTRRHLTVLLPGLQVHSQFSFHQSKRSLRFIFSIQQALTDIFRMQVIMNRYSALISAKYALLSATIAQACTSQCRRSFQSVVEGSLFEGFYNLIQSNVTSVGAVLD